VSKLNKKIAFAVIQAATVGDKEKAKYYYSRMYEKEGMEVQLQLFNLTPEEEQNLKRRNEFNAKMDIGIKLLTLSI
jgi:hypothetical protein